MVLFARNVVFFCSSLSKEMLFRMQGVKGCTYSTTKVHYMQMKPVHGLARMGNVKSVGERKNKVISVVRYIKVKCRMNSVAAD